MLGLLVAIMMAATTATCAVEQAHYQLRGAPEVTLRFVDRQTGPNWPSNLLVRLDIGGSRHRYWWLPWNGGSDGRQHLASTSDATALGWTPPTADDGKARPLGDVDYLATDAQYRLINQVPRNNEVAPSHILLPDLNEALWYRRPNGAKAAEDVAAGDRLDRQFFDLVSCTSG